MSRFAWSKFRIRRAIIAAAKNETYQFKSQKPWQMNDKTIRWNIRNVRTAKKLTQAEMADIMGISRQAYFNFEHGNTSIISKQISRMAEALDVSEEELMFGYNPEDFQIDGLHERALWQERLGNLRDEKESEIAIKEDKISSLIDLLESEKFHIGTQHRYIETLESQVVESHKQITELRKTISDLRHMVKALSRQLEQKTGV